MNTVSKLALLTGAALTVLSTPATAGDLGDTWSKERFQIRGRIIDVIADGDGMVNGTALKTDVDNAVVPEVDVTYFFTPNIAAELIAATAEHTVSAGTSTLGDTWILPPTLTLQYHFTPDQKFSPYVGAGLNYSYFYGEDDAAGFNNLDVKGGVGYALQAGFDYWLSDNWGLNLDVKYIDLEVDATVNSGVTPLSADNVDLNPWILGAGVSYRF
ncbi:MAG: OmpW family protein [Alphaproteobacteria bacterium]|nr:OmpW family protein [Alphaproteobacteria bacterium]